MTEANILYPDLYSSKSKYETKIGKHEKMKKLFINCTFLCGMILITLLTVHAAQVIILRIVSLARSQARLAVEIPVNSVFVSGYGLGGLSTEAQKLQIEYLSSVGGPFQNDTTVSQMVVSEDLRNSRNR